MRFVGDHQDRFERTLDVHLRTRRFVECSRERNSAVLGQRVLGQRFWVSVLSVNVLSVMVSSVIVGSQISRLSSVHARPSSCTSSSPSGSSCSKEMQRADTAREQREIAR